MRSTNLDLTPEAFFFFFSPFHQFFFQASAPCLLFLSLSLQQMALVRGGQVTDPPLGHLSPALPLVCPAPCPATTSSTRLTWPFEHVHTSLHTLTSSPPLPLLSSGRYLVGQPLPTSLPPVVQAFWTEQMVREGQEETSSNLGAQPDLAHSEWLIPA